jgi:hydroxymethylbilane synthase
LLGRASDLARLQTMLAGRALQHRFPDLDIAYLTRTSAGDRDESAALVSFADKGAFTADLSDALGKGDADAVVHSWKDLPLEGRPDTRIAATLERADPRDVLLIRRDAVAARPSTLAILSSSPRRSFLLERALPSLLPWRIDAVRCEPVRGNITTRLSKLVAGQAHGLVVAKAALDRLLSFGPPFDDARRNVRRAIDTCRWMVLPIRDVPGAPAQGAIAIETAPDGDAFERVRAINHEPTWQAVSSEREVLAAYGGGCHAALGATAMTIESGLLLSVVGRTRGDRPNEEWSLRQDTQPMPTAPLTDVWPRPDERQRTSRRALDVAAPSDDRGYWVTRADALPDSWEVSTDRLVWAAGGTTWRKLAARGIWVNGCADGLGDAEPDRISELAGRDPDWHRLTHEAAAAGDASALATYVAEERLPDDLSSRSRFFWTSGTQFHAAITRWPDLRDRWHACGPGRTYRTIRDTLGTTARIRVSLDYDTWVRDVVEPATAASGSRSRAD